MSQKGGDILIINKTIKYIYYTDLSGIAGKCKKSDGKTFMAYTCTTKKIDKRKCHCQF